MKKLTLVSAIIPLSLAVNVQAEDQGIEACIKAIGKIKSGEFIKLEKLNNSGKAIYEFELMDANGSEWEYMCDVNSGKIIEKESEVKSVESQAFKKKMKLTEQEAAAIALKAHPGIIQEVEYEIEENGDATYEFDIVNPKGVETKVEVDAASGKITEVSIEEWEIGMEDDERQ